MNCLINYMIHLVRGPIGTGCPKKKVIMSGFEFLTLGEVFSGVKNKSKNFLFFEKFWVVEQNFE